MTGTSKVQLPPAGIEPAVKLKLDVPLTCDPVPQISVKGKPVATMPERAASRSSLKARPLVTKPLAELLMVNRIEVVLELLKVLGTNAFEKVGATAAMISSALAAATGAKPVTLSVLVVLV